MNILEIKLENRVLFFHSLFCEYVNSHMSPLSQIIQFSKCYLKGTMTNLLRTFPKSKRKEYLIEQNCDKCLLVEKVKVKFMIWMCPSYLLTYHRIYISLSNPKANKYAVYLHTIILLILRDRS